MLVVKCAPILHGCIMGRGVPIMPNYVKLGWAMRLALQKRNFTIFTEAERLDVLLKKWEGSSRQID
ncbi:hypothetical protein J8281_13945 [Aquimarina sp. U1-2]|uniref:hypothetical protein n=1 Tax=Aquimarina sp. U1-2 TaxID=2823141 RepID=UPI001AECDD47|nr:hypothetical protein [Aquimarina sp. U1-2]MBP2833292.1 hypothetical protein [Aquimarina sp. U1-2]